MISRSVTWTFHAKDSKQQTDQQTRQSDLLVRKSKRRCQKDKNKTYNNSAQSVHVLMYECVPFVKAVQKCGCQCVSEDRGQCDACLQQWSKNTSSPAIYRSYQVSVPVIVIIAASVSHTRNGEDFHSEA